MSDSSMLAPMLRAGAKLMVVLSMPVVLTCSYYYYCTTDHTLTVWYDRSIFSNL